MSEDTGGPDLDAVADLLRQFYYSRCSLHEATVEGLAPDDARADRRNPHWDGGPDSRGVERRSVWPGLARTAVAKKLDPRTWVDTLFSLVHLFDHVPYPTDLQNKEVLARVHNYRAEHRLDVLHRVRSEDLLARRQRMMRHLAAGLPPAAAAASVVVDSGLPLSPVVRYAFALENGLAELAAGLEAAAAVQYLTQPDVYQELFGAEPLRRLALLSAELEGIRP